MWVMADVILSSKNQIVIPREARKALGLKPGDKLPVVLRGNCLIILEKPNRKKETQISSDLRALLNRSNKSPINKKSTAEAESFLARYGIKIRRLGKIN